MFIRVSISQLIMNETKLRVNYIEPKNRNGLLWETKEDKNNIFTCWLSMTFYQWHFFQIKQKKIGLNEHECRIHKNSECFKQIQKYSCHDFQWSLSSIATRNTFEKQNLTMKPFLNSQMNSDVLMYCSLEKLKHRYAIPNVLEIIAFMTHLQYIYFDEDFLI